MLVLELSAIAGEHVGQDASSHFRAIVLQGWDAKSGTRVLEDRLNLHALFERWVLTRTATGAWLQWPLGIMPAPRGEGAWREAQIVRCSTEGRGMQFGEADGSMPSLAFLLASQLLVESMLAGTRGRARLGVGGWGLRRPEARLPGVRFCRCRFAVYL